MAIRGRKETPTELKLLKGTRKDRLSSPGTLPDGLRPVCPSHLTGEAAEAWESMLGYLEDLGILSHTDAPMLEIFAVVYARWRKAVRELDVTVTATTAAGNEKRHPASAVAAAAEERLLKLLGEFGMTPSSRSRLNVGKAEPKADGLSDFLAKRNRG